MTEAQLQNLVADYLRVALPDGSIFHHSPNEGKSHVAHRVKLRKAGMCTGWPDLEIFCPGKPPVFIELKVGKNTITAAQNKTLQALSTGVRHSGADERSFTNRQFFISSKEEYLWSMKKQKTTLNIR
jgi:hypothetical protein